MYNNFEAKGDKKIMNDNNINVNVNADTKTKRRKLEKDYKKFGFTAKDILKLTVIAENDLLVDTINKNISNKLNTTDFRKVLDHINDILKLKLDEIREKKERNKTTKEKNKTTEENQNI